MNMLKIYFTLTAVIATIRCVPSFTLFLPFDFLRSTYIERKISLDVINLTTSVSSKALRSDLVDCYILNDPMNVVPDL